MATPIDELQERVRRLEAVAAAILVGERDTAPYRLERLIDNYRVAPSDEFFVLLKDLARADRMPSNRSLYELFIEQRHHLENIRAEVARQLQVIKDQANKSQSLQHEAHAVFAMQSMGIDLSQVRLARFLPVRVYLDRENPTAVARLADALSKALSAFDLEIADDFPAQRGSWFKKWIAKLKYAATTEEAKDVGRKVLRGAELAGLEKQQAEINDAQARALSALIACAKEYDNAALQCGTALVVVTSTGNGGKHVVGMTLTASQIIALENNQQLLYSPGTLLAELKKACNEQGQSLQPVPAKPGPTTFS